jgi:P-type E1-E2 ATPase
LLSADTFGRLDAIGAELGVAATRLRPSEPEAAQKAAVVRALGSVAVVAVGNGANDAAMLREAALGIAVLGPEGLAAEALAAAGLLAASIDDALDLLLHPRRLVATLRR